MLVSLSTGCERNTNANALPSHPSCRARDVAIVLIQCLWHSRRNLWQHRTPDKTGGTKLDRAHEHQRLDFPQRNKPFTLSAVGSRLTGHFVFSRGRPTGKDEALCSALRSVRDVPLLVGNQMEDGSRTRGAQSPPYAPQHKSPGDDVILASQRASPRIDGHSTNSSIHFFST